MEDWRIQRDFVEVRLVKVKEMSRGRGAVNRRKGLA